MFEKTLAITACLAANVMAAGGDYTVFTMEESKTMHSEWYNRFTETYPSYTYEAMEVESDDGYVSTLFHITGAPGHATNSDFKPANKPLLMYNGAFNNIMSWWPEEKNQLKVREDAIANFAFDSQNGETMVAWDYIKEDAVKNGAEDGTGDWYTNLTTLNPDLEAQHEALIELEALGETKITLTEEEVACVQARVQEVLDFVNSPFTYMPKLDDDGNQETDPETGELMYLTTANTHSDPNLPIRLWNAGNDVWVSGNRGTLYQKGHKTLDYTDDTDAFWNFSVIEMGTYDVKAQIEAILAYTEQPNMNFLGYSQGSVLMMHALAEIAADATVAHKETYDKLDQVLLVAPCKYAYTPRGLRGDDDRRAFMEGQIEQFKSIGMPYVFGDGLTFDNPATNDVEGNYDAYVAASCPSDSNSGGNGFCQLLRFKLTDYLSEQSIKSFNEGMIQGADLKNYRSFDVEKWLAGNSPGEEMPYESISGPQVSLYIAGDDQVCKGGEELESIATLKKSHTY
jgi:hypothetical protein